MKTIDVIVSRDGSTRVETYGFAGAQCKEASQFLEQALGLKQIEQLTADFYRSEINTPQKVQQHP